MLSLSQMSRPAVRQLFGLGYYPYSVTRLFSSGSVRSALNSPALLTSLSSRGYDLGPSPSVSQFKHGQSNPTFVVEGNGHKLVVRKKPDGKILKGAHAVEREFRVMSALKGTDVPVPEALFLEKDEAVLGTPFFVYKYVEGTFHPDCTLASASSPEERAALYGSLIGAVSSLHTLDYAAAGLADYGKPVDYISRQLKVWSGAYSKSLVGGQEEDPNMTYLHEWLQVRAIRIRSSNDSPC